MSQITLPTVLISSIFLVPSAYLIKQLYSNYKCRKLELEETVLFYKRHNCVVMFDTKQIKGWPPETLSINVDNLDRILQPYLYFINTAKKSLDISIMILRIDQIINAIMAATKRGVKVRIIVNFESNKDAHKQYNMLIKSGAEIAFFITKLTKLNEIMHWKAIIKDNHDADGFLCVGSMNLSSFGSLLNNFEDLVFTSNPYIVASFSECFEKYFRIIRANNQTIFDKTQLIDAKFITQ